MYTVVRKIAFSRILETGMLRTIFFFFFLLKNQTNDTHSSYEYILEILLQKFWILEFLEILTLLNHSVTTDYSANSTMITCVMQG